MGKRVKADRKWIELDREMGECGWENQQEWIENWDRGRSENRRYTNKLVELD